MRINVYNEELTSEIETGSRKAANTGFKFVYCRLFMKSHDDLHHTAEDDDRTAITFFAETYEELHDYFMHVVEKLAQR